MVDDGSSDGTAVTLAEDFPDVSVLSLPRSVGPAGARNRGARHARGRLLLFLDADGEVDPGWLSAMLNADTGDTVLLGNVVDYRGGRVQSVPRRATFIGKSLRCAPERANTGPSCNLGIPRSCFERLGGFDEELPYYFEDSDLCIRARQAGYAFRFVGDAVFRHHGTEFKRGPAIRLQERHSTYAMLKCYEDRFFRSLAFSVANGLWLLARLVAWTTRGRISDAGLLLRGWVDAYVRQFKRRM